ncbi:hypothetical protein ABT352_33310 [Streptosporangium sp. NPDC000563]|uniref:hypothetical protein n=1 Tax=Streptosporangium sp. NPDC000563 TaxID=3154366 RepID=UPI003332C3D8
MTRWSHLTLRERELPDVAGDLRTRAARLEAGTGTVRPFEMHTSDYFWMFTAGSAVITHFTSVGRSGGRATLLVAVAPPSGSSMTVRVAAVVAGVFTYGSSVVVGDPSPIPPGGVFDSVLGGVRVPVSVDFPATWLPGEIGTLALEVTTSGGTGQIGVLQAWQR